MFLFISILTGRCTSGHWSLLLYKISDLCNPLTLFEILGFKYILTLGVKSGERGGRGRERDRGEGGERQREEGEGGIERVRRREGEGRGNKKRRNLM